MADPGDRSRVAEIFGELLEKSPAERRQALEIIADSDVRAEVAALLEAHEKLHTTDGGFLETLDAGCAGALLEDSSAGAEEPATIGRYRIVRRLGRGGMGVVYQAHDPRLDRPVALKLLSPHLSVDPAAGQRLAAEARAASALDHPNVETVYEIGETDDDRLFIAMAYYEGETLRERIARGPMAVDEVVGLGIQLVEGLDAAHRAGIVHLDIKPENLLVTRGGVLKIVDFGVAKALKEGAATAGLPRGTAVYMSPEQTRGEAVDHRTDIWSVGIVLYEMLTGSRPFGGATEVLVHAIRHDPLPPLSERRSDLPAWLTAIVERCLEKDPARRPDAEAVAVGLREAAASARPGSRWGNGRSRSRRWPLGIAATAALAVVILVGLSIRNVDDPASIAVLPLANVGPETESEYFAEGMTEELIGALARVEGIRVVSRTSAVTLADKEIDAREVGERFGVAALLEGSVRKAGDRIRISVRLVDTRNGYHLWAETYDRELADVFAVQEEIAQAVVGALAEQLGARESIEPRGSLALRGTEDLAAYDLYLQGRYLTNRMNSESVRRGIAYFERAIERDPQFARPYAGIADAHMWLLAGEPVEEHLPKARAAARRALELDPSLSEAHYAAARIATEFDWNWPAAEAGFRRSLELDPSNAEALHRYAHLLITLGRFEEATALSEQLLGMDPLNAEWHNHLGWNFLVVGQLSRAEEPFREALELDPNVRYTRSHLGTLFALQGRFGEALHILREAHQRYGSNAETLSNLAWLHAVSGDRAAARAVIQELDRLPGDVPPVHRAYVHVALGEKDRAFRLLEQALRDRRVVFQFVRDPKFGPLVNDPRYERLLRRMGLEP